MKKIKKTAAILLAILVAAAMVYYWGPRPKAPSLNKTSITVTDNLQLLEKQLSEHEKSIPGIKSGSEAKIVWADSLKKNKTRISFLYIHGGLSSHAEGDPVHRDIAAKFHANLFLARLAGHGVNLGDATLSEETADDFIYSAEHALAVAKRLGDEVVIIGTSFGAALTTYLASNHPEVKAIVLYSPCFRTFDERTGIFIKPWGLKFIKLVTGSEAFDIKGLNEEYKKYSTTRCNLNFIAQFQNFLVHSNTKDRFSQIKCPVFMGYWYKNKNIQDTVASVPAMLEMFEYFGSFHKQKRAFPDAGNHLIISPFLSKEAEAVQIETVKFLNLIL